MAADRLGTVTVPEHSYPFTSFRQSQAHPVLWRGKLAPTLPPGHKAQEGPSGGRQGKVIRISLSRGHAHIEHANACGIYVGLWQVLSVVNFCFVM